MSHEADPQAPGTSALNRVTTDPLSRRKFVAAGGSGSALALFLAACGDDESSSSTSSAETTASSTEETSTAAEADTSGTEMFGAGDLGIVNYALTLEYLEAAFYDAVEKSGLFKKDKGALLLIKQFGANEQAHVGALEQTANKLGKAVKAPKTEFPLDDVDQVTMLAATVENVGAAAYLGQAPLIQDEAVLAAALSIHTVEARHAATLNMIIGESITPDGAFAVPMSAQEVLPAVMDFIVS